VNTVRLLTILIGVSLVLSAGEARKADLSLKALNGQRVRLSGYRSKVVVLNFWATWCIPCTAEIPMLVQAEREYGSKGVVFIAASVDEGKSKNGVPDFASRFHVEFPVLLDATMRDLLRLGMGRAVPATAFLDQEGHIVSRVQGQMREEELKERLDWLLGDRSRPAPQGIVKH
jgi:thiol-disulfide isomerase/thioredoxin